MLSLDPFGKPAADLPVGVTDYATSVRVHGDQISPERHPGPALDGRSVADVFVDAQASAAAQGFTAGDRVMSTAGWTTADELTANLLAVFVAGASLVQVANPDAAALDRRRADGESHPRVAPECHAEEMIGRRQFLVMGAVGTAAGVAAGVLEVATAACGARPRRMSAWPRVRPTSISAVSRSIRGRMETRCRHGRSD